MHLAHLKSFYRKLEGQGGMVLHQKLFCTLGGNTTKAMKEYLDNVSVCRRLLLLMLWENTVALKYCRYYDIYSTSCDCTDCTCD